MMQNKWWHSSCLEMKKQGKSSRQIAKDLFGSASKKSTVNDFLRYSKEGFIYENTKYQFLRDPVASRK